MLKWKEPISHTNFMITVLIIIAGSCNIFSDDVAGSIGFLMDLLQSFIFICLFVAWGISVSQRIIQLQVRRCLIGVSAFLVFWMIIRTVKFYFINDAHLARFLWYMYYLPMIYVPFLVFLVGMSLGKSEEFRFSRWIVLLMIYTTILVLFVLTNDFHQCVFKFPQGMETWKEKEYQYGWGYFVIAMWMFICSISSITMMVVKCRLPGNLRSLWLPFISITLSTCYTIGYMVKRQGMFLDLTVFFCLVFIATLESCIQCGLIHANTDYEALFEHGSFGSQITDDNWRVQYFSIEAYPLLEEDLRKADGKMIQPERNILIKSHPIKNGHVVWKEDITALNDVLEQLEENKENIAESVTVEWENYSTQLKINTLQEKNRLYDKLQQETAHQINLLDELFNQYDRQQNLDERRNLLARIAVIGAYIKRRGNLLFIAEKVEKIDSQELLLCIDESFANLELLGVECGADIKVGQMLLTTDAFRIYDFLEKVIEFTIESIRSIWMKLRFEKEKTILHLEVESELAEETLTTLKEQADHVYYEDNIWHFTLYFEKSGEKM